MKEVFVVDQNCGCNIVGFKIHKVFGGLYQHTPLLPFLSSPLNSTPLYIIKCCSLYLNFLLISKHGNYRMPLIVKEFLVVRNYFVFYLCNLVLIVVTELINIL